MNPSALAPLLGILLASPGFLQAEGGPPLKRITLSVREADLRDIIRASVEGTDLNVTFEPGIETIVRGLDLQAVTLEELLDQILPNYGLAATRRGRTLHISRSDGGMRFFSVDFLAQNRVGAKEFKVNSSGQTIQTGSSGGGAGSSQSGQSSAYISSLASGNSSDPWAELQGGLTTLVFGAPMEARELGAGSNTPQGPPSRAFSQDGKILLIQPHAGMVALTADPYTQRRVEAYIAESRRRYRRQVLLEARIVEVTLGKDSQIGMDWNKAFLLSGTSAGLGSTGTTAGATFLSGQTINTNVTADQGLFQLVVNNLRVNAVLSALASDNKLQVLSAPRISTLNNQKAILRVVREEAYFLQTSQATPSGGLGGPIITTNITPLVVPVGIVLDILPQVGDDGFITLAVNPSVSEVVTVRSLTVGSDSGGGASATLPVVDRRDLDTVVRMRTGETLVLAGIIKSQDGSDDRGIPFLKDLPLIGALFTKKEKSKVRTELAIFITPTLVESAEQVQSLQKGTERSLEKAGANLETGAQPKD
jgi:MSHA biogenesis protein MshL